MLGFVLKEIGKAIVISAGVKVVQEDVIPPVAEKVRNKYNKIKGKDTRSDSKSVVVESEEGHHTVECEAKWE